MSFLMLARAEPEARALLQRALRARYGIRPVPVESVRLFMLGVGRGPLGLPLRVEMTLSFVGITHWRLDRQEKLLGVTIRRVVESFDSGSVFLTSGKRITGQTDPLVLASYRRRLWASNALFLTPLTGEHVTLKMAGERAIQAIPESNPDDVATLTFHPDDTLAQVDVQRYRPQDQRTVTFSLCPENGLQTVNDVVLPARVAYRWADGPGETYYVKGADLNPRIPLTEFTMQPTA
ncbi:MAG: hypothetical protein IT323_13375 [Anaerolineae bacterium]|nr:hypothetical protein [Anaerolineae bacterium]